MDGEYDGIVIGSGAAGLSAALSGSLSGLKMLVVEKTSFIGGTTAWSGGAAWLPANPLMEEAGLIDSFEQAERYIRGVTGNYYDARMVEAFLSSSREMVRLFQDRSSAVRFQLLKLPDYHPELDGSMPWGRSVIVEPFDARSLGGWLPRLRHPKPEMTIFGGMQAEVAELPHLQNAARSWKSFRIAAGMIGRYAVDRARYGRGTRTIRGLALAGRLLRSCLDAGVEFVTDCDVRSLLWENGEIKGVRLAGGGLVREIRCRAGIVLATGGDLGDPVKRRRSIPFPDDHIDILLDANVGDGIKLAIEAGAALGAQPAHQGIWAPGSKRRHRDGHVSTYPHFSFDRCKPGSMMVNADGRRFVNEGSSYHVIGAKMHEMGVVPAWLIADHAFLRKYGMGMARPAPYPIRPLLKGNYLFRADTIVELAGKIGVDPDGLSDEVEKMNSFARSGVDLDFSKGADIYSASLGDPAHMPNPTLGPIETAPFYALPLMVTDAGTTHGLRVDPDARVLDGRGEPIPGLFAAGLDMNSVMRGHYPGGGTMIGPALTFGYVAGKKMRESLRVQNGN